MNYSDFQNTKCGERMVHNHDWPLGYVFSSAIQDSNYISNSNYACTKCGVRMASHHAAGHSVIVLFQLIIISHSDDVTWASWRFKMLFRLTTHWPFVRGIHILKKAGGGGGGGGNPKSVFVFVSWRHINAHHHHRAMLNWHKYITSLAAWHAGTTYSYYIIHIFAKEKSPIHGYISARKIDTSV